MALATTDAKCSGAMSRAHDGTDVQTVRIEFRDVALCGPCRDAGGRLGLIERRSVPRPEGPRGATAAERGYRLGRNLRRLHGAPWGRA